MKKRQKVSKEIIVRDVQGVPDYAIRHYLEKKSKTALLIPVLNEGDRILAQLRSIIEIGPEVDVIIADGGSHDNLIENIENGDFKVNTVLTKLGDGKLSAQLRMGFHYCLDLKYQAVITMDGNNKDDARGIKSILEALESGIDFVQGSRFLEGGAAINTPLIRFLAIRFVHAPLTSLGARYWYTDTTNGFRGHSSKLLIDPKVSIFRDIFQTYELLAYIPIRCLQIGLKVSEVPVIRRYPRGAEIPTKIRGFRAQLELIQILFNAIAGKYSPTKST